MRTIAHAIVFLVGVVFAGHEPIVKLVVDFALVERKRRRVHNPHRSLAHGVRVVTFAGRQVQPNAAGCSCRSHVSVERRGRSAGQAEQAPVFWAAVTFVRAVTWRRGGQERDFKKKGKDALSCVHPAKHTVFVEKTEVNSSEVFNRRRRQCQAHALAMSQLPVISYPLHVVVAHGRGQVRAVRCFRRARSACIASQCCQLSFLPAEDPFFSLREHRLNMGS